MSDASKFVAKRWLRIIVLGLVMVILFFYGIGVGRHKWPPFNLIQAVKENLTIWFFEPPTLSGEQELLQRAFNDPVVGNDLYYSPIVSLDGIRDANQRNFMLRDDFTNAYEEIKITQAKQVSRPSNSLPVVKVTFVYQNNSFEAFAYGNLPKANNKNQTASLIIPGSGSNQSYDIAKGSSSNYHYGILDALKDEGGDVFIFIKPNNDFLSWHNGKGKKLDGYFIWNWNINRDGSYSVSYLVKSLAFMKWLKTSYPETVLAGLSQGGLAVLFNGLQSQPNFGIVSSGYSIICNKIEWSNSEQMVGVPGMDRIFDPNEIKMQLQDSPTKWLFTWGRKESPLYRMEAEKRLTAMEISGLQNVEVGIHDEGHVFPKSLIQEFIRKNR